MIKTNVGNILFTAIGLQLVLLLTNLLLMVLLRSHVQVTVIHMERINFRRFHN